MKGVVGGEEPLPLLSCASHFRFDDVVYLKQARNDCCCLFFPCVPLCSSSSSSSSSLIPSVLLFFFLSFFLFFYLFSFSVLLSILVAIAVDYACFLTFLYSLSVLRGIASSSGLFLLEGEVGGEEPSTLLSFCLNQIDIIVVV